MALLGYWRYDNYVPDLDGGGWFNFNSRQERLHTATCEGDDLWLFTLTPDRRCLVVARLTIQAQTLNPPGFKYGSYRVWGNKALSKYFADDGRDDGALLRTILGLAPSVANASVPQHSQTLRRLQPSGNSILAAAATVLPLDRRVKLADEELALEASLDQEGPGNKVWPARSAVRTQAKALRQLYDGRCQLCAFESVTVFGSDISEIHHLVPFSRGGSHDRTNLCLLCPNHHRVIHASDAAFDWRQLTFVFPNQRSERLGLNRHLEPAG